MRKVIEHKKAQRLDENEYYQYDQYEKMKMSLNDITPEKMEKGIYKKYSFLLDQIEVSEATNYLDTGDCITNGIPQRSGKQKDNYQRNEFQWYQ